MLLAAAVAAGAVLLTTHDESNKGIRQEQNLREVC